jgi:hypothetical protein
MTGYARFSVEERRARLLELGVIEVILAVLAAAIRGSRPVAAAAGASRR